MYTIRSSMQRTTKHCKKAGITKDYVYNKTCLCIKQSRLPSSVTTWAYTSVFIISINVDAVRQYLMPWTRTVEPRNARFSWLVGRSSLRWTCTDERFLSCACHDILWKAPKNAFLLLTENALTISKGYRTPQALHSVGSRGPLLAQYQFIKGNTLPNSVHLSTSNVEHQ